MTMHKNAPRNFYGKNLQRLHRRSPQMVEYLKNGASKVEPVQVDTPTREISLAFRQGANQVHLHSTYDPRSEARYWAENVGEEDWQIAVVLGMGMGYHVEELLQRYRDRTVIVIEPVPDILNSTLKFRDLRQLLELQNFTIVASRDGDAAAISLFETHLRSGVIKGKVVFLSWPPYLRLWSGYWQQLQKRVGELTRQASINLATYQYFSMQWQENFFTTLRSAVTDPSVKALYSTFQGKPAILVSAGPSLQKNIHLLADIQDRALIVAAGSAIGPLMANGITPHFVVSFDGSAANYYVFSNLKTENLVLVYSSVIYPRIIAEYQGPRFVLGVDLYPFERWFFEQLGQDIGSVASGPSVANLTWDLLRQMGCDPIIFVGQDLAFGSDGHTHAKGHVERDYVTAKEDDKAPQENVGTCVWVEDIWGNQARSTSVWVAMKIWFEQRMKAWGKGLTFIDATEGGAKIDGTDIMPLQEAIDRYCLAPFDARSQIAAIHQSETQRLSAHNVCAKADLVLQKIEHGFNQILTLCDEAVEILRLLKNLIGTCTLSEDDFVHTLSTLRRLDTQMSGLEVYQHFVRPSIESSVAAFNAMSVRLQAESDLHSKGTQLFELYVALFVAVRKAVSELRSYRSFAAEHPEPYTPPPLAIQLSEIAKSCDEMEQFVVRLKEITSLPMDSELWQQVQSIHTDIGRLSANINQTEVIRWFVKVIVELQVREQQRLKSVKQLFHQEQDLGRKAEYLTEYHALSLRMVRDALHKIYEFSKIPQ